MKKTLRIAIVAIILLAIATTVKAYTNDELVTYLTSPRTVAGKTYELTADEKGAVKKYLKENPLSDADALEVKGKVDSAIEVLEVAGTTDLSKLTDAQKKSVKAFITEAGKIAGVEVKFDSAKKSVTVVNSKTGKTVFAENYETRATLPYTGTNYVVFVVPAVALVAVAMVVVVKKNK